MTEAVTREMLLKSLQEMHARFDALEMMMDETRSETRALNKDMTLFLQSRREDEQADQTEGVRGKPGGPDDEVDQLWAEARRINAETAKLDAETRKNQAEEALQMSQEYRYMSLRFLLTTVATGGFMFGLAYLMVHMFGLR